MTSRAGSNVQLARIASSILLVHWRKSFRIGDLKTSMCRSPTFRREFIGSQASSRSTAAGGHAGSALMYESGGAGSVRGPDALLWERKAIAAHVSENPALAPALPNVEEVGKR